ncbi:hypothetical protein [Gloeothece verrucosa]|uniref:Uncharacterized protein n=1 Tax=Gloeothece verrucosa (strain PCC 7822) TaxID=497965 RepID=E0U676_GLOV7|nr:hypothetical protein [Gloeothece verrucosa]ADN12412.1 hypothetical protein Cyan7822_0366 [Gloeothece verrucosa PCC 7822]
MMKNKEIRNFFIYLVLDMITVSSLVYNPSIILAKSSPSMPSPEMSKPGVSSPNLSTNWKIFKDDENGPYKTFKKSLKKLINTIEQEKTKPPEIKLFEDAFDATKKLQEEYKNLVNTRNSNNELKQIITNEEIPIINQRLKEINQVLEPISSVEKLSTKTSNAKLQNIQSNIFKLEKKESDGKWGTDTSNAYIIYLFKKMDYISETLFQGSSSLATITVEHQSSTTRPPEKANPLFIYILIGIPIGIPIGIFIGRFISKTKPKNGEHTIFVKASPKVTIIPGFQHLLKKITCKIGMLSKNNGEETKDISIGSNETVIIKNQSLPEKIEPLKYKVETIQSSLPEKIEPLEGKLKFRQNSLSTRRKPVNKKREYMLSKNIKSVQARQHLDSQKIEALEEQLKSVQARQHLDSQKIEALEEQLKSVQARQHLDSQKIEALEEQLKSVQARQHLDSQKIEALEGKVDSNFEGKDFTKTFETLLPPPPEIKISPSADLLSKYQQQNLSNSEYTTVTLTTESREESYGKAGKGKQFIFERNNEGKFWIVTDQQGQNTYYWLFLSYDLDIELYKDIINASFTKTIKSLSGNKNKWTLKTPARVKPYEEGEQKWELDTKNKGEIEYIRFY